MRFSQIGARLAALAVAFAAVPCDAQSLDWQGFYVGVTAGAAVGTGRMDHDPSGSFNGPVAGDIADGNAFRGTTNLDTAEPTGSLQAGYQVGHGRFRFGLEGEAGYLGMHSSKSTTKFVPAQGSTFRLDQKIETDFFASLRPRMGYVPEAFAGDLMLFATGGVTLTHARIRQKFTQTNINPNYVADGLSEAKMLIGWTVGGGAEYALSNAWSVKGEYLYANLGTSKRSAPGTPSNFANFTTNNQAVLTSHIVRAGIAFHF